MSADISVLCSPIPSPGSTTILNLQSRFCLSQFVYLANNTYDFFAISSCDAKGDKVREKERTDAVRSGYMRPIAFLPTLRIHRPDRKQKKTALVQKRTDFHTHAKIRYSNSKFPVLQQPTGCYLLSLQSHGFNTNTDAGV